MVSSVSYQNSPLLNGTRRQQNCCLVANCVLPPLNFGRGLSSNVVA
jgi:hypothetical protein